MKAKAKQKKRVAAKDLEVGGVYEYESYGTRRLYVYLGRVLHTGKKKHAWAPIHLRGQYHLEASLGKGVTLPAKTDYQGWFDLNRKADKADHARRLKTRRMHWVTYKGYVSTDAPVELFANFDVGAYGLLPNT